MWLRISIAKSMEKSFVRRTLSIRLKAISVEKKKPLLLLIELSFKISKIKHAIYLFRDHLNFHSHCRQMWAMRLKMQLILVNAIEQATFVLSHVSSNILFRRTWKLYENKMKTKRSGIAKPWDQTRSRSIVTRAASDVNSNDWIIINQTINYLNELNAWTSNLCG